MTITLPWSDNPATTAVHVRARHINELRNTVDRNRRAANLPAITWTDNPVSSVTHFRAVHFTEVRAAIPPSVPIGNWSVGSPPASSRPVSARDMNDLRGWVDQFSQSLGFPPGPDPVPQGITSFTFDPDSTPQSIIDSTWVQDIVTLSGQNSGPLRVRAIVTKGNQNYQAYQSAFQLYANRGLETFAVLDNAFDPQGGSIGLVTDALTTQGGLSNRYIDDFSSQAEGFAGALLLSGLRNYFVWNEPNNSATNDSIPLDQTMQYVDQFAALLYQTYRSVKNVNNIGDVYMGGLLWPLGAPNFPTPALATASVGQYLTAIYNSLKKLGISIIPWDAINVHVHHCGFSQGDMINLRQTIDQARAAAGDTSTKRVIVGEWGVTHTEQSNNPGTCIQNAFTFINSQFDAMWYFQHSNNPPSTCDQMDTPTQEYFGAIQWDVHAPPPGGPYQIFYKVASCGAWNDLVVVWS